MIKKSYTQYYTKQTNYKEDIYAIRLSASTLVVTDTRKYGLDI